MIKCIAIDDEPLALELLEDNISKVPYLQLIARCENAMEAMKIMQAETIDLIFLDIQMPGLTGLQFIQTMTIRPMIILITAYEKFALDGFNLDVVDYLLKPVSLERFVKACNKANEVYQLKTRSKETAAENQAEYFFVNADYSLLKVVFADILYIEGLKDYIKIHLRNAAYPVITRMTMKLAEDQLPASKFIRIHKSYIVSITHITSVRKNSILIETAELPVSDNYRYALGSITGRTGQ